MSEDTLPPKIEIGYIIADVKRYLRSAILVGALVGIGLILPVLNTDSKYTSTAAIMLDPRLYNDTPNQQVVSNLPADTTQMDSEVEVMKSTSIASVVIAELNLDKDPEFNKKLTEKKKQSNSQYSSDVVLNKRYHDQQILDEVLAGLTVKRKGLTRIIDISYTSKSAEKASKILNVWLKTYLQQQVTAKISGTQNANLLVGRRLDQLRIQVENADAELQNYKVANGLMSADGKSLTEQEISNYSQQVAQAKADLAQATAKMTTARQQLNGRTRGDDLNEALNSSVIQNLRRLRADVSKEYTDLDARYGPLHPDIIKTRQQLKDIDNKIAEEINRIVSSLSVQVEVQRQRLSSLENSLEATKGTLKSNNLATVHLKELETNAESVRAVYESYLNKYKETAAAEGNAKPDARIVSMPNLPVRPSEPHVLTAIALSLAMAALSAALTIVVRRLLNNGIVYGEEIENQMNVAHVASVVSVNSTLPFFKTFKGTPMEYIAKHPLSIFAEGVRSVRASILYSKQSSGAKVIALTSSIANEGKTTMTLCLAQVMATSGQSILVVDCDLRRHSISNKIGGDLKKGLIEFVNGDATLEEVVVDGGNGVSYLPIAKGSFTSRDIFGSEQMRNALNEMKNKFDFILLDTAPVVPIVDTRILALQADATVLIVKWNSTQRKLLSAAVDLLKESRANLIGVVLNQLDIKKVSQYGYSKDSYYRSDGSKSYFES